MFNNVALDVVIGLAFIFLLYSLLATIIQEIIATKLAFRAKVLEKGILRMLEEGHTKSRSWINDFIHLLNNSGSLNDKRIAAWFYAHPSVKYLGENNHYSKPAYLSSQVFSKVMIDLLKGTGNNSINAVQQLNDSIRKGIIYHLPIDLISDSNNPAIKALRHQFGNSLQNGKGDPLNTVEFNTDTKVLLQSLWTDSGADIVMFKQKLERWFDDTMDRATGWYKRYTQSILFFIGFIVAIGFNVDTITIAKKLMKDPKLREQLVQSANNYLERNKEMADQLKDSQLKQSAVYDSVKKDYDSLRARTKELMNSAQGLINTDIKNVNQLMGLGWNNGFLYYNEGQDWTWFFGWLITALSISLGAPFWFDLLSKLVKLRGTGTKADPSSGNQTDAQNQQSSAPVSINVNTHPGTEAVG